MVAALAIGLLAGCEIGVEQPPTPSQSPPAGQTSAPGQPRGAIGHGQLKFVAPFASGCRQAAAESKPTLLFFTAEWCQFCHQMEAESFTDPRVVSLSERFICTLVDADAEPEVCRRFQINGYPTIQFLSPQGVPLNRIVGKQPGHQLVMAMQTALQTAAARREATATGTIER